MSNNRILRINELIQQEISKIILKEVEAPENSLITVSDVKTSDDLAHAKIWISVFPQKHSKKMLGYFLKNTGYLQKLLNRRLSMKFIPKIKFIINI